MSKVGKRSIKVKIGNWSPPWPKVRHLQPNYLCLSRLGCSLGELHDVGPDKICQAKHGEDKNLASIY